MSRDEQNLIEGRIVSDYVAQKRLHQSLLEKSRVWGNHLREIALELHHGALPLGCAEWLDAEKLRALVEDIAACRTELARLRGQLVGLGLDLKD